jgi:hypothetical protein
MRYRPAATITLARMAGSDAGTDPLVRARRLRLGSRVCLCLWLAGWVAFAIVVGTSPGSDAVSALAVVICVLFALGFVLEARARRLELRELTAVLARDDLVAARSRGIPRVR